MTNVNSMLFLTVCNIIESTGKGGVKSYVTVEKGANNILYLSGFSRRKKKCSVRLHHILSGTFSVVLDGDVMLWRILWG